MVIDQEVPGQNSFTWKPFLKQEKFLQTPLSVKEGFYAGAVNAGKSDVLLMYPIVHGWHKLAKFKGLFLRRTMPELRNEIWPRARDYYTPFGAKGNKQEGTWTFPSGAIMFFGHCENESDVHNYDTAQWNYVAFDELTSFTEWQYIYITIERTRVPKSEAYKGLPAIVRSASNPGNTGHTWVRRRFIDPCPKGGEIIRGKGGIKRIYIPATINDNPYADPIYKAELDGLPEAERKAKKYGDWSAYEGQVFDEFREKHYPTEPDNAVHIVDQFIIPDWWPRIVAIDWGFAAMTYVLWAAISPKKRVYLYREQSFIKHKIEEWTPFVKEYIDKENPTDLVICHSAGQHRGEPHTILEQVCTALGKTFRLSEKDRIAGKLLVHEYLRWRELKLPEGEVPIFDEEMAQWLLRNKGLDAYKLYHRQFMPMQKEDNLPKIQIFNTVKLLPEALKACVYEKDSTDGKKKEDVKEFGGDDPYDCFRYILTACDRYFEDAVKVERELDARDRIVTQLEVTQDMTAYYRNMRKLESENIQGPIMRPSIRKGYYGSGRIH